jgi:hypothetical protein
MHVRFVVAELDEESERERGIFQAAYLLTAERSRHALCL